HRIGRNVVQRGLNRGRDLAVVAGSECAQRDQERDAPTAARRPESDDRHTFSLSNGGGGVHCLVAEFSARLLPGGESDSWQASLYLKSGFSAVLIADPVRIRNIKHKHLAIANLAGARGIR